MKKNRQILKSFIALALGILLALVISEILLQMLDFPKPPVSGWLSCNKTNPDQCNSMGFRGKDFAYSDDDFVVVLLGDSEVYAAASPFEQIPERKLERFLQYYKKNVKVFTLADMGYGHDQQYLALKKYYENYRADLVLLMYTARNDIENIIFPTSGMNNTIKPTYWLEDNVLHGPTEGWLEAVGPRLKLILLWNVYFGENIGEARNKKWEEQILPPDAQPTNKYNGGTNNSLDKGREIGLQNAVNVNTKEMDLMGILIHRNERTQYGIKLTRKLLFKMKELIEANNGHFIVFKDERPEELQDLNIEHNYFINGKYYRKSIKQYQDNLKDIFIDFEHYRIPLTMRRYTRDSDNIHLNDQALEQLMKELSLILSTKDYFK